MEPAFQADRTDAFQAVVIRCGPIDGISFLVHERAKRPASVGGEIPTERGSSANANLGTPPAYRAVTVQLRGASGYLFSSFLTNTCAMPPNTNAPSSGPANMPPRSMNSTARAAIPTSN